MGTRGYFTGGKAAGALSWTFTPSSAEVKECLKLYLHSSNTPSWRGAHFKKAQGQLTCQCRKHGDGNPNFLSRPTVEVRVSFGCPLGKIAWHPLDRIRSVGMKHLESVFRGSDPTGVGLIMSKVSELQHIARWAIRTHLSYYGHKIDCGECHPYASTCFISVL
jgi:hypothetical protein